MKRPMQRLPPTSAICLSSGLSQFSWQFCQSRLCTTTFIGLLSGFLILLPSEGSALAQKSSTLAIEARATNLMITSIAEVSEVRYTMQQISAKMPPITCIRQTKKAAAGFEKSNGWLVTYFIIFRPWRRSPSTCMCIRMVTTNRAPRTLILSGSQTLKFVLKTWEKTKVTIKHWKPKTNIAAWQQLWTSSMSRSRSPMTCQLKALNAIAYVSLPSLRVSSALTTSFKYL